MATITENPQIQKQSPPPRRKDMVMGVSAYDQVSGLLISVLTGFGAVVGLMFIVWWSSRVYIPTPPVAVMVLEDVGGGGKGSGGGERVVDEEFEEPSTDEIPPTAEAKVEESLDAISLAAAQPEVMAELTLGEMSSSSGNGEGTGQGDGRGPGPGGPGTSDGIPSWERWEVRLNAPTIDEYARQLDFFKIELALAGGGSPVVTYVTNVATSKPTVRTGDPKKEKRLRFMHRSGALRDADRKLVQKAGVDPSGKVVFQFYSQETYDKLLLLENIQKGQRRIIEIRRTIFGVRQAAGKYEFFVISQEYR
ncbi:hypothetical protein [Anatilimnocola floriformis]|uniref:hypothetical protein n=1 Tax=Anatilimnocola floriformis TaxID=2948575 RepID=UPI0020C57504|nr:hypothetical protein [Anatilimnocola floriformis]